MGEIMVADIGPMARFEGALVDETLPTQVFQRLTEGERPETLEQIAKSRGFPRGAFVRWFATEHKDLLDAAEKVLGIEVAHAVKAMTDEATGETLKLAKFKTDRYLRLAEVMNGERYSRKQEVKHSGLMPTLVIEIGAVPGVERVIENIVTDPI